MTATLTHETSDGVLGFELRAASTEASTAYYRAGDSNSQQENVLTIDWTESANTQSGSEKEYYIKVYAEGDTGHQAQTYQLQVNFSAACFPDSYELTGSNNSQQTATEGRDGSTGDLTVDNINASLCSGDTDYYKYFLLQNETITVTPGTGDTKITIINSGGDVLAELADAADGVPPATA